MKKIISVILALITAASLASFGVLASDSAEGILGDGNRDGKINVKDIVIAIRAAIGQTMDNIDLDALDINRDGNVDVKDIIILIRHSTGYKQSYLIGYPMSSVPSAKPLVKVVSGVEFITYKSSITYKGQKDEYAYTVQNDGLVRIDISELKAEFTLVCMYSTVSGKK